MNYEVNLALQCLQLEVLLLSFGLKEEISIDADSRPHAVVVFVTNF